MKKPPLKRVTPHGVGDARRAEGTAVRRWRGSPFVKSRAANPPPRKVPHSPLAIPQKTCYNEEKLPATTGKEDTS